MGRLRVQGGRRSSATMKGGAGSCITAGAHPSSALPTEGGGVCDWITSACWKDQRLPWVRATSPNPLADGYNLLNHGRTHSLPVHVREVSQKMGALTRSNTPRPRASSRPRYV